MTKRWTIPAAALLLLSATSSAQMRPGRFWRDPRLKQELGLKPTQVDELEQLHMRERDRMVDLRATMEKRHLAVEDAFDAEPFDEAAARAALTAEEVAASEIHKTEATMRVGTRKALTLEQYRKLEAMRPPGPPHGPPPHAGMGGPHGPGMPPPPPRMPGSDGPPPPQPPPPPAAPQG